MRYRFEGFTLDSVERRLLDAQGAERGCAPKTFDALQLLVENGGQLLRREQFHQRLWPRAVVADETLGKLIWQVRKALAPEGETLVETVPRHGYRLRAQVEIDSAPPSAGLPQTAPALAAPEPPAAESLPTPRQRRILPGLSGLGLLMLLLAGLQWWPAEPDLAVPGEDRPLSVPTALAAAETDADVPPWVAEALSAALALELGMNERPRARLGEGVNQTTPAVLTQHLSSAGPNRWRWQIGRPHGELQVTMVLEGDADVRTQIQQTADAVRAYLGLPVPGLAQSASRETLLPQQWPSLRAYAEADSLLMQRRGAQAAALLEPVVAAEPGFVPALSLLARAYYLQARDPEAARVARQGLARSAQLPPELRLTLESQLDEAEGRFDEAYERAQALHQLLPMRYVPALTAARLAGHTGRNTRFDQLIEVARELGAGYPEVDLLDSVISLRRGQHERALAAAEASANAAEILGWNSIAAEARLNAARALGQLQRFEPGLEQLGRARALADTDDASLQAQLNLVEGTLLMDLGRFAPAAERLQQAADWFRSSGALFELASVLDIQGQLAEAQGQLGQARRLADESLQVAEASGDRHVAVAICLRMAQAYLNAGEIDVARHWLSQAVSRVEAIGNPGLLATTLTDWALSAWQAGSEDEALAAAGRALPISLEDQDWELASTLSGLLGDLALSSNKVDEARQRLDQARAYAERSDQPLALVQIEREQARRATQCRDYPAAGVHLQSARAQLATASADGRHVQLRREHALLALIAAELALREQRLEDAANAIEEAGQQLDGRADRMLRVQLALIGARRLYRSGNPTGAQDRLRQLGDLKSAGLARSAAARERLQQAMSHGEEAAIDPPQPPWCAKLR
ncbi:MAG: winged helix-turn-helix domain-containing protein [Rhodanobacteraceae bacterium]|nr:winged helix-turn-helix domain-containing protein [Rhodanobacteraceae bacterium]